MCSFSLQKTFCCVGQFSVSKTSKGAIYTEEVIDFENADVELKGDSLLIYANKTYKVKVD